MLRDFHRCNKHSFHNPLSGISPGKKGVYVTDIDNGDYIKVRSVAFRKRTKSFEVNVAVVADGGHIEVHLDSLTGKLLGTCAIKNTGGLQSWVTQSCAVKKVKGIHDLYFVFKGDKAGLFNFNWWRFKKQL